MITTTREWWIAERDRIEASLKRAERDNDWPNVYRLEDELYDLGQAMPDSVRNS